MSKQYDYIIAGAGAAGLSLVYYLLQSPLSSARILLLDRSLKDSNDRTWCFWAAEDAPFQEVVCKEWTKLFFVDEQGQQGGLLAPLTYKMIRGLDFYQHVWRELERYPNVEFRKEKVLDYAQDGAKAIVTTDQGQYKGQYVFNSCLFPKRDQSAHFLFQHFAGWQIKTEAPAFNPQEGYLMDFRSPQPGDTRFFYLLPLNEREALVEFTLFSPCKLKPEDYQAALEDYVEHKLGIPHYSISEHESGAIPMTDQVMPATLHPRVINIGTAGGAVKPTTGYAFINIQQQVQQIVAQLAAGQTPDSRLPQRARFRFYDRLLLNILQHFGGEGKGIFARLFRHNSMRAVFRFLGEDTHFLQEARIFLTLPIPTFLAAVARVYIPKFTLPSRPKFARQWLSWPKSFSEKVQAP